MTEYQKLESLHWGLDELIQGNQLTDHELKTLQSFVEDIREKYLTESEDQWKNNSYFGEMLISK